MGLGEFKKMMAERIAEHLEPVRQRYEVFIKEDEGRFVDYMATQGMRRGSENANETMEAVKKAVGLWT